MLANLNLWRLEYGDDVTEQYAPDPVTFEFGTYDTGYPLTKQVTIGAPGAEYGDSAHPLGDGVVFGRDLLRSRRLGFAGAHFDGILPAMRTWAAPLDLGALLEGAWAAEQLRLRPEMVAKLTNVDRDRSVYGRPRGYAPDLSTVRGGWSEWTGWFDTVDDRFYGPEKTVTAAATVASIPATGPSVLVVNDGPRRAFPHITFNGTGSTGMVNPRVHAFPEDNSRLLWTAGITARVTAPGVEPVVGGTIGPGAVDARPWERRVELAGLARPGLLLGSRLGEVFLESGTTQLRFQCEAGAGTVLVAWSDTYGSL